jgi:cytochrome c oxidase subunit 3
LHYTVYHHVGFEISAWYWHSVDIVWLFLYIYIYIWGSW